MYRRCRYAVSIVLLASLAGCPGSHTSRTSPDDAFSRIPVSPLPIASTSGSSVLLLTLGGLVLGDTTALPELAAQRAQLTTAAYVQLDSALRRDARDVEWQGLEEQRRTVHRNPTLGLEPDRFATAYLIEPSMGQVPDPLFAQIRTLAAITGARYAVIPAGARLTKATGGYRGEYVLVAADVRTGTVLWRGRAVGQPAATPEAALASAAGTVVASPLQNQPAQPRP
jgi:hypothetical protein